MLQNVSIAHAAPSNTRSPTPPLSALAPTRDLKRIDAPQFIVGVTRFGRVCEAWSECFCEVKRSGSY